MRRGNVMKYVVHGEVVGGPSLPKQQWRGTRKTLLWKTGNNNDKRGVEVTLEKRTWIFPCFVQVVVSKYSGERREDQRHQASCINTLGLAFCMASECDRLFLISSSLSDPPIHSCCQYISSIGYLATQLPLQKDEDGRHAGCCRLFRMIIGNWVVKLTEILIAVAKASGVAGALATASAHRFKYLP